MFLCEPDSVPEPEIIKFIGDINLSVGYEGGNICFKWNNILNMNLGKNSYEL